MCMSGALQPPVSDVSLPARGVEATGARTPVLQPDSAGEDTVTSLKAECSRLAEELAGAEHMVERLEIQREFLAAHAKNLEREIRLSRWLNRTSHTEPPAGIQPFPDTATHWRQKYEEVVASRSWRIMWWIGTPYRAWLTWRRGRAL